jgi:hypothetical protein
MNSEVTSKSKKKYIYTSSLLTKYKKFLEAQSTKAIQKSTSGGQIKKQDRRKNILLYTEVSYIHRLLLNIITF